MCYQIRKGLWNFSKTSNSEHYPYSLPFFQNYYSHPFYSLFIYHLTRINIFFLLKKVVRTNIFQDLNWELSSKKENSKWFEFALLKKKKKKEVKENPNSRANRKFQCLVVNGRFQCLVTNEMKSKNTFSPFPTFLMKFYLNLHFYLNHLWRLLQN